jgi:hypothetical protein
VYRSNQPPGPIDSLSRASGAINNLLCVTNVQINALLARTNQLAVAITQATDPGGDAVFGLVLDARYYPTPGLPAEPPALLTARPVTSIMYELSWQSGGHALESTTNLWSPLSYPIGPWLEVSNMTNPFIITTTNEPLRFFRLKKK